jgi:hypothetical protein
MKPSVRLRKFKNINLEWEKAEKTVVMAEHMLSMHKALASILNMKYQKIKTSTGQ